MDHLLNAGLCRLDMCKACRCEDESIDELAAFLGVGDEVAAMTARYGVAQARITNSIVK